jgi:peptidoglycan/LPS O-acetylase OafA/YrhL
MRKHGILIVNVIGLLVNFIAIIVSVVKGPDFGWFDGFIALLLILLFWILSVSMLSRRAIGNLVEEAKKDVKPEGE